MSVELLDQAAKTLRAAVAALPVRIQATWSSESVDVLAGPEGSWVAECASDASDSGEHSVTAYLVLMQPALALTLAQWLEGAAELQRPSHAAFEVARAILRESS